MAGLLVWIMAAGVLAESPEITWYGLRAPGDTHDIEQGSGLCFGRIGQRAGLWIACDRNGGDSAGRIYRVAPETLAAAVHGRTLVADEAFAVVAPSSGWPVFRESHAALGSQVLDHLQERVEAGANGGSGPNLDLEAITIAPSADSPDRHRLFVVAEEPYSLVLELEPTGKPGPGPSNAKLIRVWRYPESGEEQGADINDGLEGLAWAGKPGVFWWAEEGTRLHRPDAHPRLFFSHPRIGSARLEPEGLKIDARAAEQLTASVRGLRKGEAQTLNALCATPQGQLLAVDRNGGWVLQICPRTTTAKRWFSLYDVYGVNLREALADFPGPRRMPYISIEGIATDDAGHLWLVDDPAMPEAFRCSCLIRISHLPAIPGEPARPRAGGSSTQQDGE